MAVKYLDTYTCYFMNSETQKKFKSHQEAMDCAARYVGNDSWVKLSPYSETWIFGPGDGTTSVMVRRDFEIGR